MAVFLQDLRFGARMLMRQPGFTLVALLVLAVGIGVNTAAFGLVNALVLKPRPGGVDAELAGLYSREVAQPDSYRSFSWNDYALLRDRKDLFASLAAHGFGLVGLEEQGTTRRVFADIISASFFETFGVAPSLGRGFTAEEERPGADVPVVILSHGLWQRLGGTPDVIGRSLTINTRPFTVVGVAPPGFGGSMVLVTPEVWVPTGVYESMAFDERNQGQGASLSSPDVRPLILVARLAPGATIESLGPGLDVVSRQMAAADPAANADFALHLAPLARLSVSTAPQTDDALTGFMTMLLVLAAVVLLIASFNLANMLLARGRARSREFAIRLAIGSGTGRVVRQLLTENLLLATLGAAAGLILSTWATRYLFLNMPAALPVSISFDTTPDVRVVASTIGFAIVAALLFGLGPAIRLARTPVLSELKEQSGDVPARRLWLRWLTTRDTLVMGQLALSFVMLTAAGLFVRGAVEAAQADPGFTLDRGIIANLDTTLVNYPVERSRDFYQRALADLRARPEVTSAGFASHMPFGEFESATNVQLPGPVLRSRDPDADGRVFSATTASIGTDYFATLGVPVRRGREFTAAEEFGSGGDPIAIIDETLAGDLFGDENPVGRQIQTGAGTAESPVRVLRVVGVAGGVRANLFETAPRSFLYQPFGQQPRGNMYLHARTTLPSAEAEAALLPAIRQQIAALAPIPPIVALETRPMFRERNLLLGVVRTGAMLFAVFGLAGLFLAVMGIYGVKAYMVSRRTREIGVRMALGAEPRAVVALVVREGLALSIVGLLAGAGLSVLAGQAMRSLLFQGRALDLPVIAVAAATLLTAMLVASWLPARRATRVAPTQAMRAH